MDQAGQEDARRAQHQGRQLTVFRKAESRSFPVTIIREEIRVQSVRAKMSSPATAGCA